jgi:hypothetical protein
MWKSFVPRGTLVSGSAQEDADFAGRDRDGRLKGEPGRRSCWGSHQEKKFFVGSGSRCRQSSGHIVNGAKRNCMKLNVFWQCFDTTCPYFHLQAEGSNDFAEEGGLFVLRFGKGYGDLRAEYGDGEAGEACPGAEVEESVDFGSQMLSCKETLSEVTADYLFRVANRREIGAGVPLEKEFKVNGKPGDDDRRGIRKIRGQK